MTAPDVAVTPDGEWLILTMLGKLFRLSVKGGEAEQLTIGPHDDNEFYAEAGIPPIDILPFGTKEAAKTVGAEDNLGTLEAGKLADLILLDANPLEDIKNAQKIWRVFKGGWMFDPKVLRPNQN